MERSTWVIIVIVPIKTISLITITGQFSSTHVALQYCDVGSSSLSIKPGDISSCQSLGLLHNIYSFVEYIMPTCPKYVVL